MTANMFVSRYFGEGRFKEMAIAMNHGIILTILFLY
jgi:Na+-driven multidrug efflux pump